mmetsp:Transcript_22048/g.47955  ORF Transcript_22048/g.47955 Transcript_22048/m.47955 type:complete len:500 (-) Transcript_22048:20-1519(-)
METTPSEEAEGQAIVRVLAVVLERLVSANSHLSESPQEQTHFHAQRAPAIGILQYLERIHKYASCSKECFILALIYIDRLIQRNNFLLTELNAHRVVITAVLLAAKFFDDAYYNNAYYAKVGGVLVEEMNNLECQFLFKIDFSLRVLPEVFEKYHAELISHSSAMGLDRISKCTDDELFCPPHQQVQPSCQPELGACQQHQSVAVAAHQAPLQQTYSQTEVDYPAVYPNHALAAPLEGFASQYPIQALHRSVTAPAPLAQVTQQQQQHMSAREPVYPFPVLASQVSAQQQVQAPPAQNHIELDLVYQHATMAAAPQDVSLSQYNPNQALHHGLTTAPQAQVYAQADLGPVYHNSNPTTPMDGSSSAHYPLQADAMTQAPVYSQHTNYFNNGAVQTTQQPLLQNHSEITPSPPPQPPINMHGAPIAYHNGEVGCAAVNLASMAYMHAHQYSTPTDAALSLHHQQLLPSRPIAIGNHRDNTSSWSYNMLSLQRSASASDPT